MIKLKNVSGFPLTLFKPSDPDSFQVGHDETVSVPGSIESEDEDKIVIEGRAYSKKVWQSVTAKKKVS